MPLRSKSSKANAGCPFWNTISLPVRAMMLLATAALLSLAFASLSLLMTFTALGRSLRNAPSAMALLGGIFSMRSASCRTVSISMRVAVPRAITHALASLLIEPSGASAITLVRIPLDFVKTVS